MSPWRSAHAAAAARDGTPSFVRMFARCRCTVCGLSTRRPAMAWSVSPRATRRSTSFSRSVSSPRAGNPRREVRREREPDRVVLAPVQHERGRADEPEVRGGVDELVAIVDARVGEEEVGEHTGAEPPVGADHVDEPLAHRGRAEVGAVRERAVQDQRRHPLRDASPRTTTRPRHPTTRRTRRPRRRRRRWRRGPRGWRARRSGSADHRAPRPQCRSAVGREEGRTHPMR